jgi:hypothetical protein
MADPDNSPILNTAVADVPAAMRRVYRRLERWRKKRKGRERIPKALWVAAGELAREHGVNQVSRVLRLEFKQLRRAAEAGGLNRQKQATPTFVEFIAPQTPAAGECVLELESPRGKLRIELKRTAMAEVTGISRALWEMLA